RRPLATVCEIRIQTFTPGRLAAATQVPVRMNRMIPCSAWLAVVAALAATLACAQPAPMPPPVPADATPVGPAVAQPPLPAPLPGVLTQAPNGAEARGDE